MKRIMVLIAVVIGFTGALRGETGRIGRLTVLCYHDIPDTVELDEYAVDRYTFIQQVEYLRSRGYRFVSLDEARRAARGGAPLPEKAVMLTFDDGYASFYEFVYPLLRMYGYPCVLAVVTGWLETPPSGDRRRFMTWDQVREVAASGLVEVASHSHDLHCTVMYNPMGSQGAAADSRMYRIEADSYENEWGYRNRVFYDATRSRELLREKAGVDASAFVWPYGAYSRIAVEEARKAGFDVMLALGEGTAPVQALDAVQRHIVVGNPAVPEFAREVTAQEPGAEHQRVLDVNLDLLYDEDELRQRRQLDAFVDRVIGLRVSTVYLTACPDEDGDGVVSAAYFPNRVLPVKSDLFSYVVNQLVIRGVAVYASLPVLGVSLPGNVSDETQRVRGIRSARGGFRASHSRRLSPFNTEARSLMGRLCEDLAACSRIDGVVFRGDGYLTEFEDFSPYGMRAYRETLGGDSRPYDELGERERALWAERKTQALIAWTDQMREAVLRYRPEARFARTLSASVLERPDGARRLAQDYARSLETYDYVVVEAFPYRECARGREGWLKRLAAAAKAHPQGLARTVFTVQTFRRDRNRWIDERVVDRWLRALAASGARHLACSPDNALSNKPAASVIRLMMSTEEFPLTRRKTR